MDAEYVQRLQQFDVPELCRQVHLRSTQHEDVPRLPKMPSQTQGHLGDEEGIFRA